MSVTLVKSDNLSSSVKEVLEMFIETQEVLVPNFIIVPDRFTLQCEKILLSKVPCLINTRIVTFSMLYNLISSELSPEKPQILDKTRAVLFMWRAIEDVAGQLKWFAGAVQHYSFAEQMFNTINQLTSSMVDFQTLEKNARNSLTGKKMHDIALIQKRYKEITKDYTDSGGMLGYLIKNLHKSRQLEQANVYICGFEHLSLQRLAVLDEIRRHAKATVIGLRTGSEMEAQTGSILFDVRSAVVNAKSTGKQPPQDTTTSTHSSLDDEAIFIANQVRGLLNGGARSSDITVLLCDYENTHAAFVQAFSQANIHVNTDIGTNLMQTPLGLFVRDWLAFATHDKAETFLVILKSVFISIEDTFKIENFCLKTNYGVNRSVGEFPTLSELAHFQKTLSKCRTVRNITKVLEKIIKRFCFVNNPQMEKANEILGVLSEHLGDRPMTLYEFSNLFATLATATKVSSIPRFVNRVMLGNTNEHQPYFTPHIFVANTSDLTFPTIQPDTDILTQFDIKHMAVTIEPTPIMQNQRTKHHAMNVLTSFTETLHLSHLATSEAKQSEIVEKIFAANPGIEITKASVNSKHYASFIVLRAIGNGTAFDDAKFYSSVLKVIDMGDLVITDFSKNECNLGTNPFFQKQSLSVTQLESFYTCPYLHFLQRGLGLRKRQLYKIGKDVVGNLIHKIMEEYTKQIISKNFLSSDQVITKVFSDPEFAYFTSDPINKPLIEGIRAECRMIIKQMDENLSQSLYKPKHVEHVLKGRIDKVDIVGKVDRIDTAIINGKEHALVIDYKTGSSVDFKYKDLYIGTKLQLPLYLGFTKNYEPGGAVYFHLKSGFNKESKYKGIVLGTQENLHAIGQTTLKGQTGSEVNSLIRYSHNMAAKAISQLQSGLVLKSSADKKACSYCLNSALCFHKKYTRANNLPSITKAQLFQEIQAND